MAEYNPITDVYTEVVDAELREEFTFIKDIDLQEKTATANGIILPDAGKDGLSKVTVAVPLPSGSIEITENGEYDVTMKETAIVNLPAGGGDFPFVDEGYGTGNSVKIDIGQRSADLETLFTNYLHKETPSLGYSAVLDDSFIGLDYDEFLEVATPPVEKSSEYAANVPSGMISSCHLDLLLDASNNSQSTRTLSGNINNYAAVLLNGIYYTDKTSSYNTTMVYVNFKKNKNYWTGMKDRNTSYDCYVNFTSDTEVSLSGGQKHCMIYGVPK